VKPKRALSARSAWNCEQALEDRCRCRCGGRLHGAKRQPGQVAMDDPHSAAFYCPACGHVLTPEERARLVARKR
jgi:hypothetical protein